MSTLSYSEAKKLLNELKKENKRLLNENESLKEQLTALQKLLQPLKINSTER